MPTHMIVEWNSDFDFDQSSLLPKPGSRRKTKVISYTTPTPTEQNYHLHSVMLEFLTLKWQYATKEEQDRQMRHALMNPGLMIGKSCLRLMTQIERAKRISLALTKDGLPETDARCSPIHLKVNQLE